MNRALKEFKAASETFGCEGADPWAAEALHLLYSAPRIYEHLLEAWDSRYPGAKKAVYRLMDLGFVTRQDPISPNGSASDSKRSMVRYVATAAGRELSSEQQTDPRTLSITFPKMAPATEQPLETLLGKLCELSVPGKDGMSVSHMAQVSGLSYAVAYSWASRLEKKKFARRAPAKKKDKDPSIPAHYRPTRSLTKQAARLSEVFPDKAHILAPAARRMSFLKDIPTSAARNLGDWSHDVAAQEVVADMLKSQSMSPLAHGAPLLIEPVINLATSAVESDSSDYRIILPEPFSSAVHNDPQRRVYQPDAVFSATFDTPVQSRCVLEYERQRHRADGWLHVEKFMGYMAAYTFPGTPGALLFVVDTPKREKSYVAMCEAFADSMAENPTRLPSNRITLAVSTAERLKAPGNPLLPSRWATIQMMMPSPSDRAQRCILHKDGRIPMSRYDLT